LKGQILLDEIDSNCQFIANTIREAKVAVKFKNQNRIVAEKLIHQMKIN
jgi:hypothetical protein